MWDIEGKETDDMFYDSPGRICANTFFPTEPPTPTTAAPTTSVPTTAIIWFHFNILVHDL